VEHRHLLPDEFDLLIDGEVGFGVAPLQAHVERCEQCRAELEEARNVVMALEQLPHLAPSPLFAERVMTQVQVFEPWYVPALTAARRWAPASRPARMLVGAGASVAGLVFSAAVVWAALRLDTFLFFFNLVTDRARMTLVDAAGSAIAGAFGQAALDALRSSSLGIVLALSGFVLVMVVTALGLRAIAASARRRRA
jgi:hypothetical protein